MNRISKSLAHMFLIFVAPAAIVACGLVNNSSDDSSDLDAVQSNMSIEEAKKLNLTGFVTEIDISNDEDTGYVPQENVDKVAKSIQGACQDQERCDRVLVVNLEQELYIVLEEVMEPIMPKGLSLLEQQPNAGVARIRQGAASAWNNVQQTAKDGFQRAQPFVRQGWEVTKEAMTNPEIRSGIVGGAATTAGGVAAAVASEGLAAAPGLAAAGVGFNQMVNGVQAANQNVNARQSPPSQ